MTREQLALVKKLEHDIELLKEMQRIITANHLVVLTPAENGSFQAEYPIDPFEQFVNEKLLEATKKLEEL